MLLKKVGTENCKSSSIEEVSVCVVVAKVKKLWKGKSLKEEKKLKLLFVYTLFCNHLLILQIIFMLWLLHFQISSSQKIKFLFLFSNLLRYLNGNKKVSVFLLSIRNITSFCFLLSLQKQLTIYNKHYCFFVLCICTNL